MNYNVIDCDYRIGFVDNIVVCLATQHRSFCLEQIQSHRLQSPIGLYVMWSRTTMPVTTCSDKLFYYSRHMTYHLRIVRRFKHSRTCWFSLVQRFSSRSACSMSIYAHSHKFISSVGDAVRDAIVINTRADICFAEKQFESDLRDRRSIHKVHIWSTHLSVFWWISHISWKHN